MWPTARKRKGFFHILEVIIVAMLIFVILTQLYSVPKANQPWDAAKVSIMSEDLLYSLEAKGVDWFDKTEVNRTLYDVLPKTMGYSVSVSQDVRPVMRIGVVCGAADFGTISAILSDFQLNGIQRDFVLTRIEPGTLDLSNTSAHYQNDAIMFVGAQAFLPAQIDYLERYLAAGNGVLELSGLTEADVSGSRWYGEVMNLEWVSDSLYFQSAAARAYFPYMDPDERRYPVQKIFLGVPPSVSPFASFGAFGGETLYPADMASEKIVAIQDSYYVGGFEHEGMEVPLSTIDWGVNGSGRVAWMSNASISGSTADVNSTKKLLKSLAIWTASGKKYPIIEGSVSTGATATMRKIYMRPGGMYEPVRIDLTVGYHY